MAHSGPHGVDYYNIVFLSIFLFAMILTMHWIKMCEKKSGICIGSMRSNLLISALIITLFLQIHSNDKQDSVDRLRSTYKYTKSIKRKSVNSLKRKIIDI